MALSLPLLRYGVVLQLHRRFVDCGYCLAQKLGVPFVLKIEALEVREEASWGTHRPGWGPLVESWGERRVISKADLLLPISTSVDSQLAAMGVPASKRQVLPSGVDTHLFCPGPPDDELLTTYQMEGQQRVGWVGGFRPFHGLELLPALADRLHEKLPGAVLYLVGTGPLRKKVVADMADRPWVRLIGPVPHEDVPRWIRCFDVALLVAGSTSFHYSPLKLYEYLACGAPVVAANVGDIGREIVNGRQAMLVPPGDPRAMVDAVSTVILDPHLRRSLSQAARQKAVASFSWETRADLIVQALDERVLLPRHRPTSLGNPHL
jgi:glycosyltransferase involved in cell wall biosynthesis